MGACRCFHFPIWLSKVMRRVQWIYTVEVDEKVAERGYFLAITFVEMAMYRQGDGEYNQDKHHIRKRNMGKID